MANLEHLAELYKGVDRWNRWRERNPEVMPDLSDTSYLYRAELNNADLSGANLSHANL